MPRILPGCLIFLLSCLFPLPYLRNPVVDSSASHFTDNAAIPLECERSMHKRAGLRTHFPLPAPLTEAGAALMFGEERVWRNYVEAFLGLLEESRWDAMQHQIQDQVEHAAGTDVSLVDAWFCVFKAHHNQLCPVLGTQRPEELPGRQANFAALAWGLTQRFSAKLHDTSTAFKDAFAVIRRTAGTEVPVGSTGVLQMTIRIQYGYLQCRLREYARMARRLLALIEMQLTCTEAIDLDTSEEVPHLERLRTHTQKQYQRMAQHVQAAEDYQQALNTQLADINAAIY